MSYVDRDSNLRDLGYRGYGDYLESVAWACIRLQVIKRDRGLCIICSKNAAAVHHVNYSKETLRGDTLDHLYSICNGCHKEVELDKEGNKRSFKDARNKFWQMVKASKGKGRVLNKAERRKLGLDKGGGRPAIGLAHKKIHLARRKAIYGY